MTARHLGTTLQPRQGQQLLHDTRHAIDTIDNHARRTPRVLISGIRLDILGMHLDAGQGRPQLVCRIGSETTFLVERVGQASQQAIERIHHPANLIRRLTGIKWL